VLHVDVERGAVASEPWVAPSGGVLEALPALPRPFSTRLIGHGRLPPATQLLLPKVLVRYGPFPCSNCSSQCFRRRSSTSSRSSCAFDVMLDLILIGRISSLPPLSRTTTASQTGTEALSNADMSLHGTDFLCRSQKKSILPSARTILAGTTKTRNPARNNPAAAYPASPTVSPKKPARSARTRRHRTESISRIIAGAP
jgi:hypothetical protein